MYMYICIYIYTHVCICIYIYISLSLSLPLQPYLGNLGSADLQSCGGLGLKVSACARFLFYGPAVEAMGGLGITPFNVGWSGSTNLGSNSL